MIISLVALISFLMIQAAPGDTLLARLAQGGRVTPAELEEKRAQLGIDRPIFVQFGDWVGGLLRGDLGNSLIFEDRSVTGRIVDTLPKTLELVILSTILSLLIAIPIGVLSAVKQDGVFDFFGRMFAILGLAIPNFFLGIVVVVYFGIWFGISPPATQPSIFTDPYDNLKAYVLPSLVLGVSMSAVTMRMTRATVLEVLRQDFVRTARAKGLRSQAVLIRHVLRNSLVPIVTVLGNQFAFLIGGTVVVEQIFGIRGLGDLIFTSINSRDYTQIMGNTLFVGTAVVLVNLLVDVSYAWIDPRIRYA
ncbi:MAG: ABC transporter permease [Dehalococcoidia bacterium]|nr:ABC transporter permease [Dehalococcoidia bacterium]